MTRTFRSKYGNKKVATADGVFDSQKEYKRWVQLKLMERAGIIQNLTRQQTFELIPKQRAGGKTIRACNYIADFVYIQDGKTIVEDTKGVKTKEYKIKKKLMLWRYGIDIKET